MGDLVDCRALAANFIAQREVCAPEFAAALAGRFGIDPERTLTEIDGTDYGDAEDWGDLPQIHALRYVPLGRFSAADVGLMAVFAEVPKAILPLARLYLEADPLVEAQHYAGDLLVATARLVAFVALGEAVRMPAALPAGCADAVWMRALVDAARTRLRADFDARAGEEGIADPPAREAWKRICDGPPLHRLDWYYDLDDQMNVIAEAAAWVDPPRILLRAYRNALYSWPAGRRQLHIVAPPDEAQAERTSQHSFRRDTVFEIAAAAGGPGVRLLSRSPSAIEDWRGTAFGSLDAAKAFARTYFGVGEDDWKIVDPADALPADHWDLR